MFLPLYEMCIAYARVFSVPISECKDAGFCEDAGGDIAAQLILEQESISPIGETGFQELVIRTAQRQEHHAGSSAVQGQVVQCRFLPVEQQLSVSFYKLEPS